MTARGTVAEICERHGSQGGKTVLCARCKTDIQPYAGRRVAAYRDVYVHHAGQCADAQTRAAGVRSLADQPGLFSWSCTHVEPAGDLPLYCNEISDSREEYAAHAKGHGARELKPSVAPIRLRKSVPHGPRQAPRVPPFKRVAWETTDHVPTGEYRPAEQGGGPKYREVSIPHRGQFWCNGAEANSVVVIEDMRAEDKPNRLVTLWINGTGRLVPEWSEAKYSRREASRVAKRAAEHAA